jgi:hypothetical protein
MRATAGAGTGPVVRVGRDTREDAAAVLAGIGFMAVGGCMAASARLRWAGRKKGARDGERFDLYGGVLDSHGTGVDLSRLGLALAASGFGMAGVVAFSGGSARVFQSAVLAGLVGFALTAVGVVDAGRRDRDGVEVEVSLPGPVMFLSAGGAGALGALAVRLALKLGLVGAGRGAIGGRLDVPVSGLVGGPAGAKAKAVVDVSDRGGGVHEYAGLADAADGAFAFDYFDERGNRIDPRDLDKYEVREAADQAEAGAMHAHRVKGAGRADHTVVPLVETDEDLERRRRDANNHERRARGALDYVGGTKHPASLKVQGLGYDPDRVWVRHPHSAGRGGERASLPRQTFVVAANMVTLLTQLVIAVPYIVIGFIFFSILYGAYKVYTGTSQFFSAVYFFLSKVLPFFFKGSGNNVGVPT